MTTTDPLSETGDDVAGGESSISRRRSAARDRGGEAYARRRAEIVAAAAEVFRAKGFRATTLADIAEAVGGDRATLYFYVSSKDEIFDEVVSDVVKANLRVAEDIRDSTDTPAAKLRALMVQLMDSYAANYPFLYIYLQENFAHVDTKRRNWALEFRQVNRRYEAAVQAIVEQGIQDGSLGGLTDARVLAYGLIGMMSWTHRWFNPETSTVSAGEIGEAYADLLLNGLLAGPRAPVPPPDSSRAGRSTPHPDVLRLAQRFAEAAVPTYDTMSVTEARAQIDQVTRLQTPPTPIAEVRDVLLPGALGSLPARVYHPLPGTPLPVAVYFHGGGWVLGGVGPADGPCRALAAAGPCVVVSVDYRRAPETKFPGPLQDCVAAASWIAEHREDFGGADRLVLVGDSAGGNLATATAMSLRDSGGPRYDAQVLLYPSLAPPGTTEFGSYTEFADGPLMTRREMEWFWEHYLRDERDGFDPLAAPLRSTHLADLPPATVVVAEFDVLRDEGIAYARRVQAAGVEVDLVTVAGAAHGFWWMDKAMSQAADLTAFVAAVVTDRPRPPL